MAVPAIDPAVDPLIGRVDGRKRAGPIGYNIVHNIGRVV